jgi:hypothetical protein
VIGCDCLIAESGLASHENFHEEGIPMGQQEQLRSHSGGSVDRVQGNDHERGVLTGGERLWEPTP